MWKSHVLADGGWSLGRERSWGTKQDGRVRVYRKSGRIGNAGLLVMENGGVKCTVCADGSFTLKKMHCLKMDENTALFKMYP